MGKIIFKPHEKFCPDGKTVENSDPNITLLDLALHNGIHLEHACEKVCACTTCHVFVRQGLHKLDVASDQEEDMLDKAWGLDPDSRLGCQIVPGNLDLEIEIPLYTINLASEGGA